MTSRIYERFETRTGGLYGPFTGDNVWYGTSNTVTLSTSNVTEGTNNWLVADSSFGTSLELPYQNLVHIDTVSFDLYNNSVATSTFNIYLTELNSPGRTVAIPDQVLAVGHHTLSITRSYVESVYSDFDFSSVVIGIENIVSSGTVSFHLNKLYFSTSQLYPIPFNFATSSSGTTSATITMNKVQQNDLLILYVETANQAVDTPAGWSVVPNSPQGTGTAAGVDSTRLSAFYKIWNTGDSASVTVTSTGADHVRAIVDYTWNTNLTTPIHTSAGGVAASSTTAVSFPSVTTTNHKCLIYNIVATATDSTSAQLTAYTNASVSDLRARIGSGTTTGNGGGISSAQSWKDTSGVVSSTTGTLVATSVQGLMTIAVAPITSPIDGTVIKTLGNVSLTSAANIKLTSNTAKTLSNISLGSATKVKITGTASKTLASLSSSSTSILVSTAVQATLSNLTLESATKVKITSNTAKTLDGVSLSSTAVYVDPSIVNSSLQNVSISSTGKLQVKGSVSKTLDGILAIVSGGVGGALDKPLANLTSTSAAKLKISSDSTSVLENLGTVLVSNLKVKGVVSNTLQGVSATSAVEKNLLGSLSKTLDDVTAVVRGIPFILKNIDLNVTLGNLTCSSRDIIDIGFESYFPPVAGYNISDISLLSTSPEIVYYSDKYASLYDNPKGSLASYGQVSSFKVVYNVIATYTNISDPLITFTDKKIFKTDIVPNWSVLRDATLKKYFEGSLINNMTPTEFIDYMKSQGFYT